MIILNVDLLQRLLGEHWRYIIAGLLVIVGLLIWRAVKNTYSKNDWINEAQKRQQKRHEYTDPAPPPQEPTIYKAQHGQWSPTGWIFDADEQKWIPPDYLSEESQNRWKWDEEKRIWIDLQKPPKTSQRDSSSHPDIKIVRNGPTYEEWKNQYYKEIYEKLTKEAENPRD